MDIKSLLKQMTLEEKASLCSGSDFWHTKAIERLHIPKVMVSDGPHGLRKQDDKSDHLGINESIKAVCFPTASATAASFDVEALAQIGDAMGITCQHEEVAVALGPAVNIKRSPLCGRNFEYFSEDPYLTSELSVSYINALQKHNIGASVKHFAANNQEHRRMSSNSVVDERTLREIYYPAFEASVKKANTWTVMCSYNQVNGTLASENHHLLTEILREQWGFDGYVVSDWGAVSDRVAGIQAGMDLEMPSPGGANDKLIVDAVKNGTLDEKVLDTVVERLLTITYRYLDHAKPNTPWDKEAQDCLARKIAADCMVLLKNDDNLLPLKEGDNIAVIGEFAQKPRFQGGGSSHINSFKITSLMDSLQETPGVTYAKGYDIEQDEIDEGLVAQAVAAAKGAKVAVIVAGLPDSFESEGYDRSHLSMPKCQNHLINEVANVNPNTVVVLYNGSPVVMPWLDKVKAVVEAYLGGQAVGGATKDVLFGQVNPSGRLPETFPLQLEDNPSYLTYGGEKDHTPYSEGIFVGYRYYDKKKMNVLFPFGHGLSYTTFAYSNLSLDKTSLTDTETLQVKVDVTNTGKVFGKEVIQLYVHDKESTVFRPLRELKGFTKVALNPGESKTVSFTLDKRSFAYWNETLQDWHVETGDFAIQIAKNSREVLLEKEVFVKSTVALPQRFTINSIYADVMETPQGQKILSHMGSFIEDALGQSAIEDSGSEVGQSAITKDMAQAMLMYFPLRGMVNFSQGKMTLEQLHQIIDALNNPSN